MSGYEAALAKAQKLTDKENQEEVAGVQASMKYATDNHLLTERMVKYFADYLNQLQDKAAKPDAPTSSKGEEQPPVLEVPEFKGGVNAVEALVNEKPAYTGLLATAGDQAAPTIENLSIRLVNWAKENLQNLKLQFQQKIRRDCRKQEKANLIQLSS